MNNIPHAPPDKPVPEILRTGGHFKVAPVAFDGVPTPTAGSMPPDAESTA